MKRSGASAVKRLLLALLLCLCAAGLCRCAVWELEGETTASAPNLSLLRPSEYEDDTPQGQAQSGEASYRVDLWLDGSQPMGGVNPNDVSIYPHNGRQYREGGFHYYDAKQKPWYESVLTDLTLAAGDRQVRALRYGNELLPDELLISAGLAAPTDDPARLASLRRDLMTYAVSPTADDFAAMTGEDMAESFYGLGTPMLNQMARFGEDGGAALENPGLVDAMSGALDAQIAAIAAGEGKQHGLVISHEGDDYACPLAYALQQMDFDCLNVITADPAAIRRLSGMDLRGQSIAYYESLFRDAGVLTDRGLSVGLVGLRLDYMGQLASICAADLSEPLIWGKPMLEGSHVTRLGVMPRELLVLVIGPEDDVRAYLDALCRRMDADETLQGERGPTKQVQPYTANGATLYGEPFTFAYETAIIVPPSLGYYTQNTAGCALAASDGSEWARSGGLDTVTLWPDADGLQPDRTLTVSIPIQPEDDMRLAELTARQNGGVQVVSSLVLSDQQAIVPEHAYQSGTDEQIIALRDTVYVYRRQELPFASTPARSPFALAGLRVDEAETQLTLTLAVDGAKLTEGYYRLELTVDVPGDVTSWPSIPWIDGYLADSEANGAFSDGSLNADVTTDDVYRWETFTEAVARNERPRDYIGELFRHAWGRWTDKTYDGMTVPDCPPVYQLLQIRELTNQLRAAATQETRPYARFVLDVFVQNQSQP